MALELLPGHRDGEAAAVSADGTTIVGVSEDRGEDLHAVLWSETGEINNLGRLEGAIASEAYDVSADGTFVVGYNRMADGDLAAFLWSEDLGMIDLTVYLLGLGVDLTGWDLSRAYGISDDGMTITGYGKNPDGNLEAWVADLNTAQVPVPGAVWLLGSGLLGLLDIRRRRNR